MNTIADLELDTAALLAGYLDPADREALYDRLWHCLQWQQVDPDARIDVIIGRLFDVFVTSVADDVRMVLYLAAKEEVAGRRFNPSVFLNFARYEIDERIVSTAAIDLLAFGNPSPLGSPAGFRALCFLIAERECQNPGALFGAAISFGEPAFMAELWRLAPGLTVVDIQTAARMQTGYANHASIRFWVSLARAYAENEDPVSQSIVGSCASALVRIHQLALHPVVADIRRHYPACDHEYPVTIARQWSLSEYANVVGPDLSAILAAEVGPKIFGEVLQVWTSGGVAQVTA